MAVPSTVDEVSLWEVPYKRIFHQGGGTVDEEEVNALIYKRNVLLKDDLIEAAQHLNDILFERNIMISDFARTWHHFDDAVGLGKLPGSQDASRPLFGGLSNAVSSITSELRQMDIGTLPRSPAMPPLEPLPPPCLCYPVTKVSKNTLFSDTKISKKPRLEHPHPPHRPLQDEKIAFEWAVVDRSSENKAEWRRLQRENWVPCTIIDNNDMWFARAWPGGPRGDGERPPHRPLQDLEVAFEWAVVNRSSQNKEEWRRLQWDGWVPCTIIDDNDMWFARAWPEGPRGNDKRPPTEPGKDKVMAFEWAVVNRSSQNKEEWREIQSEGWVPCAAIDNNDMWFARAWSYEEEEEEEATTATNMGDNVQEDEATDDDWDFAWD